MGSKKDITEFQYIISPGQTCDLLNRLGYRNSSYDVFEDGEWVLNQSGDPITIKGIGYFDKITDELPSVVFDNDNLQIYIIDKKRIDEYNELSNKDAVSYLTMTFKEGYATNITWNDFIERLVYGIIDREVYGK